MYRLRSKSTIHSHKVNVSVKLQVSVNRGSSRNFFWAAVALEKKFLPPREIKYILKKIKKKIKKKNKKNIDFANSDSVNYLPTKCKNKQPFPIKNTKNVVSTQAGCQTAFTKEWEWYTLMINIMLIYRD